MSDTPASLRRSIASAGDLQAVVRSMKALAGASISQYEQSVLALAEYYRSVELGLSLCLRQSPARVGAIEPAPGPRTPVGVVVFGSDQGLVGQFNEQLAAFTIRALGDMPGDLQVWAVGERMHGCLEQAGVRPKGLFRVPSSVMGIAPLVGQIQLDSEAHLAGSEQARFHLFHNRPQIGMSYAPFRQRLLPLDRQWQQTLASIPWPSGALPEILHDAGQTLRALIREYLFISLFRACAESLASENASRLAAMQRADKNIEELLAQLHSRFNSLRQSSIDAELFEVIAGYESLSSR